MPANPLHFLAIAPLHFKRPELFDPVALFWSSILVDSELLISFLTGKDMNHGVMHSYIIVLTLYPILLSLAIYVVERIKLNTIDRIYRFLRFYPKTSKYNFKTIFLSCLIGGASHVFFDSWVHEYSPYILFPLVGENIFWVGDWSIIVTTLVTLLSLYTVILWVKDMPSKKRIKKEISFSVQL